MQDRYALEVLLAPVGGDGVGADPREDPVFLDVKDARGEARLAERAALASGDPEAEPLRAGLRPWTRVAEGASSLLADRAKDLQLAAWLTEALLRTDGFSGLGLGLALMAGLVEDYWDAGLYPHEDEDGVEARVAPLFGLFGRGDTGTLLQPIKLQPLTDAPGDPVALWTIENAQAQSTRHDDPDLRDELVARRQERLAGIDDAIARASPAFADAAIEALETALVQLDRLMTAVDERTPFGRFGSQVQRPLEDALALLRAAHARSGASVAEIVGDVAAPQGAPTDTSAAAASPAVIARSTSMTREGAIATLLDVAAFFERNEPQSLVGPGLRDLVRRADLPMDALLRELLPEDEQRAMFLLRAGIRATSPADDGSYY